VESSLVPRAALVSGDGFRRTTSGLGVGCPPPRALTGFLARSSLARSLHRACHLAALGLCEANFKEATWRTSKKV
jgi:hypothetical protein